MEGYLLFFAFLSFFFFSNFDCFSPRLLLADSPDSTLYDAEASCQICLLIYSYALLYITFGQGQNPLVVCNGDLHCKVGLFSPQLFLTESRCYRIVATVSVRYLKVLLSKVIHTLHQGL